MRRQSDKGSTGTFRMGRNKVRRPQYRLVLHNSAEECLDAYVDGEEFERLEFFSKSGKPFTRTRRGILKAMKRSGVWGFYDHDTKKIHLWFDKRIGIRKLIGALAHEAAHSKQTLEMPRKRREMEATRAEEVAIAAFDLAILLLSEFTKRKIPWRYAT